MTVLYCLSHIQKSLQWLWFAEELKNRGIDQVYVLIENETDKKNYFYEDLVQLKIPVYRLVHRGKTSYFRNILWVRSLLQKTKPDIIHTSLPLGNIVGQSAAFLCGLQNRVTTCENASWAHDFKSWKQKAIDNYTFRLSKRIIATSEIARHYLLKNWTFDKTKLVEIHHGLKPEEYNVSEERTERLRNQLGISRNNFTVGIVARFEFWKGHEYIVEAANILKDEPRIKFYIFGSKTSYYDTVRKRIEELGLQDKIIYGGFVEDTSALYPLFDVHLHVPVNEHVETGGITIIEGMMAGRPQILTRSGYAWQVSKHLHNAYLVPFRDSNAIAQAIRWVMNNPAEAQRLAAQAKQDASAFQVKKKADHHIKLYNELLK